MNKAESDRLAGHLESMGYQSAENAENADLVLLNGCVVRQSAENRVVNKLKSLNALKKFRPNTLIGVTGCIVGPDKEKLRAAFPYIDYLFPPGEFPTWLGAFSADNMHLAPNQSAVYIPIMQGCNNFCSYCIVPYRRGRERSRPIEEIVNEVSSLVKRGIKEVTLLGQNVDSYGQNLPGEPDLADLLTGLNSLEGLMRIRFLTNHPKDMKSKLIDAVASLDKVCEQINLPVQSGDNEILKDMRRGYTVEHYRELIAEIRSKVPEISLSTDLIVGFPGETDRQFLNSYRLMEEIKYDMVHVAAYSPREGTLAAREMKDDVPPYEKKIRLDKIEQLQAGVVGDINAALKNQVVEILVEKKEKGKWCGRTRGDKLVFFSSEGDYLSRLVNVKITHTSPWSLTGEVCEPE